MYAQLGAVVFAVVGPVMGLEASRGYNYVEHAPIQGKPRLQQLGDGLEEVELRFALLWVFCNPSAVLAELQTLAERHEAVPLVWASGQVQGRYVVRRIEATTERTDNIGIPLHITGRISLVEWVEPPELAERRVTSSAPAVGPGSATRAKRSQPNRPASTNPRAVSTGTITRRPGS